MERLVVPLLRLLRRDSLFDTLNDEDIFFSEFEGGKPELERIVGAQLPPSHSKPRPGGFTFKLPSRTSLPVITDSSTELQRAGSSRGGESDMFSEEYLCYPNQSSRSRPVSAASPPYSARSLKEPRSRSNAENLILENQTRHHRLITSRRGGLTNIRRGSVTSGSCFCPPLTLQKVCCPACRAKAQQACQTLMKRDRNVSIRYF